MKLNDPRISGMLRRERPGIQLIAGLLLAALPPEVVDAVVDNLQQRGPDTGEIVAGKPFLHWIGKNWEQIHKECGCDVKTAEITRAFLERGMQLPGAPEAEVEPVTQAAAGTPAANPVPVDAGGSKEGDGDIDDDEPTFGGFPVSELRGKTDQELLKIEGIGPKTILKIREWESANPVPVDAGE